MALLGTEITNMYYNPTTGDIQEFFPVVGSVSPIPQGYMVLSRIKALETFTNSSGVTINKDTMGGLVLCRVDKFESNKNLRTLEQIIDMTEGNNCWVDSNSKLLDNISISGNVNVISSTLKGSGSIKGRVTINNSTVNLKEGSELFSTNYDTTIDRSDVNIKILLYNKQLTLTNVNLNLSSTADYDSCFHCNNRLTVGSNSYKTNFNISGNLSVENVFEFRGTGNYTLKGTIKGSLILGESGDYILDMYVDTNSVVKILNNSQNANLNIVSGPNAIVTVTDSGLTGAVNARSGSNVTLENITLNGNLTIDQDVNCNVNGGTLGGELNIREEFTVEGTNTINGIFTNNGPTTISGTNTIDGQIEVNTTTIEGSVTINGTLDALSDMTLTDNVIIKGNNRFLSPVEFYNNLSFGDNAFVTVQTAALFKVGDNVKFDGECLFKGTPVFRDNAVINGCKLIEDNVTVSENAVVENIFCLDNDVVITGNAKVSGDVYITDNVFIGGDMNITINNPIEGYPTVDKYDVSYVINFGHYEFDWKVTVPYQMAIAVTNFKEPIYMFRKDSKDIRLKIPTSEEVISLSKLSLEINELVTELNESSIREIEDLQIKKDRLRRISLYYYLARYNMLQFCSTEGFDPDVFEIEPLSLFKC